MGIVRDRIMKFGNNLSDTIEIVTEQVENKPCLVVRSTTGRGTLFTGREDWEVYAWLCGYAHEKDHPIDSKPLYMGWKYK